MTKICLKHKMLSNAKGIWFRPQTADGWEFWKENHGGEEECDICLSEKKVFGQICIEHHFFFDFAKDEWKKLNPKQWEDIVANSEHDFVLADCPNCIGGIWNE